VGLDNCMCILYSIYNFEISGCWPTGINNIEPDAISRLSCPDRRQWFGLVFDDFDVTRLTRFTLHGSNESIVSILLGALR